MNGLYDEEPTCDLKNSKFDIDLNYEYELSVATSFIKTKKQEEKTGREKGKYVIINSPNFVDYDKEVIDYTNKIFVRFFNKFVKKNTKKILVAGIGNEYIESDCFGPLCVNKLKLKNNIYAIKPNVFENTNIMSYDIVKSICDTIRPDLVILIDSLGTKNIKRLTTSFQITDVGLLPGGALSNKNTPINKKTLGVDCLVIGVPCMLFASGLNENLEPRYKNIILTPKDVRITLDYCAEIVVNCIDQLF